MNRKLFFKPDGEVDYVLVYLHEKFKSAKYIEYVIAIIFSFSVVYKESTKLDLSNGANSWRIVLLIFLSIMVILITLMLIECLRVITALILSNRLSNDVDFSKKAFDYFSSLNTETLCYSHELICEWNGAEVTQNAFSYFPLKEKDCVMFSIGTDSVVATVVSTKEVKNRKYLEMPEIFKTDLVTSDK